MAARERQRDKQAAIPARRLSWPTVVLAGGVLLSLAANLARAQPMAWGRIVAAVPPAAPAPSQARTAKSASRPRRDGRPRRPAAGDEALLIAARRASAGHQGRHGQPITRDAVRARLGVSNQAASELLRQLRADQGLPPGAARAA